MHKKRITHMRLCSFFCVQDAEIHEMIKKSYTIL